MATNNAARGNKSSATDLSGATDKLPLGATAARWIEQFLVHSQGDFLGRPFKVHGFQREFLDELYAVDRAGRRIVRRALLGMGKGGGKSELAAAIAVLECAGPFAPPSPDVIVVAASLEQAGIIFDAIRAMIASGPLRPHFDLYDAEIVRKDGSGRIRRIAANYSTADGLRPTAAIFDELHEYTSPQTARTYMIVANGLVKRANSIELSITTAGADLDSLLGGLYELGKRGGDPSFLFRWYAADDGHDLDTDKGLRAAIRQANPGVAAGFLSEDRLVARFREVPRFEFARYYLNRWVESGQSWLPPGAWPACEDKSLTLDPALPITAGVDFGFRFDATAVIVAQRQDEKIVTRATIWSNPYPPSDSRHAEWSFDLATLANHLRELFERYPVPQATKPDSRIPAPGPLFLADPWQLRHTIEELAGEGLNVALIAQHDANMVPACASLYDAVMQRRLAHDGDPVFAAHVAAAIAKQRPRGGWRLDKATKSGRPIDAAEAAAMAVHFMPAEAPKPYVRRVRVPVGF